MRRPVGAVRTAERFAAWRMVAFAAIALGMTGPGQTVGVSVFVDPMPKRST